MSGKPAETGTKAHETATAENQKTAEQATKHQIDNLFQRTAKVEEALARFEAALRLFEAAVQRAGENRQESISTRAEAEALRDDRARLVGEVHAVRSKSADLVDRHRQATARVDTAMAKIRAVLGG